METYRSIDGIIGQTPGTVGGKPRIDGTRIYIHAVAIRHKRGDLPEQMVLDWPHVSLAQIYVALAFYYANQEQIEKEIQEELELSERLAREHYESRKSA